MNSGIKTSNNNITNKQKKQPELHLVLDLETLRGIFIKALLNGRVLLFVELKKLL